MRTALTIVALALLALVVFSTANPWSERGISPELEFASDGAPGTPVQPAPAPSSPEAPSVSATHAQADSPEIPAGQAPRPSGATLVQAALQKVAPARPTDDPAFAMIADRIGQWVGPLDAAVPDLGLAARERFVEQYIRLLSSYMARYADYQDLRIRAKVGPPEDRDALMTTATEARDAMHAWWATEVSTATCTWMSAELNEDQRSAFLALRPSTKAAVQERPWTSEEEWLDRP